MCCVGDADNLQTAKLLRLQYESVFGLELRTVTKLYSNSDLGYDRVSSRD